MARTKRSSTPERSCTETLKRVLEETKLSQRLKHRLLQKSSPYERREVQTKRIVSSDSSSHDLSNESVLAHVQSRRTRRVWNEGVPVKPDIETAVGGRNEELNKSR
eukprot:765337-Hanusia_phi.AAC.3